MLNKQQLAHFETFGFIVMRQVFTANELAVIDNEYEKGLSAAYAHAPFDGTERYWTTMMGPDTPFFATLLEDARFYEVAEQLYGEDAFGVASSANRYVGNTLWHPDHQIDPNKDSYGIKFAYYLDPVDGQSGVLRVIPGSHRNPFHDEVKKYWKQTGKEITDIPGYVCESKPGDIVAFDSRLWHASWGGAAGRRMCSLLYYSNPKTAEEEAGARHRASTTISQPAAFNRTQDAFHHPHWVANPTGSVRRGRWIQRLTELGYMRK